MSPTVKEIIVKEIMKMLDKFATCEEEVSEWVKRSKAVQSVTRIPGDASARRYYRVVSSSGETYILMRTDPFPGQGEDFPFLAVQRHLSRSGIDVPKVFDVDPLKGFVLLEDLGDTTLLRRLQEVAAEEVERHLYETVIDSLVRLQVRASVAQGAESLDAFKLRFDREKLMWEVEFTIEHFYGLYLKRNISEKDLNLIRSGFSAICQFLAEIPTVLTHRDFHSRNIMVTPAADKKSERLVMIDFQDARLGPPQYDLSSLLKDSYYQLEESQIERLLDYYIARWKAVSDTPIDRASFVHAFDLMSVQRNFKAIGSFASFLNRRGDSTYLKFIGNTFENIRRTLLKYPQYAALREVLFHYYYF